MRRIPLLLALIIGCYQPPERPTSLAESLPHVISVLPEEEEVLFSQSEFHLMISEPLDETTATPNAVFLLEGELPPSVTGDTKALFRSLEKNEVVSLPIQMVLTDSGRTLSIQAEDGLRSETRYTLVLTPRLLSRGRLSVTHFSKRYNTLPAGEPDVAPAAGDPPTIQNDQSPSETTPQPAAETSTDDSMGEETPDAVPEGFVVINEIFYDAVGSDLNGLVFIELFGTPGLPVGGYQIYFVNGEDGKSTDSITLPEAARIGDDGFYLIADSKTGSPDETQVVQADLIDEFDPQNGPDAVQLVSPDGILLDAVGYGEGMIQSGENGLAMYESSPTLDVPSGHSLERSSPGQETDNNAADFVEREVPTPGY
ncbi:MAG: lamin tail domain-containing protein [Deltaproteobacteria bacterium]|nr:lamin tail domain-containing protein [Deltaproteobacteria bacterium]MBI4374553.1 lamin tail domain-containing protein [Deltaproteobacteria bacterium]